MKEDTHFHPLKVNPLWQLVHVVDVLVQVLQGELHLTHVIWVRTGWTWAVYPDWQDKQLIPELQVSQPVGQAIHWFESRYCPGLQLRHTDTSETEHLPQLLSGLHSTQFPPDNVYPNGQISQAPFPQLVTGLQINVAEFRLYPAIHEVHLEESVRLHDAHGILQVEEQVNCWVRV